MNALDYIRRYENFTFKQKKITEIDNVIFSILSYVYYDDIVSTNSRKKITIKKARDIFFKKYSASEIKRNILAVRNGIRLLDEVSKTKRYKDLLVYNYASIANDNQQFSAITIEINPKLIFVSFEGTDQLISGWEEDFMMTYMFPVSAQKSAVKYLNRNFTFRNCNILVGGHSKGGNLSLVSSMYCNYFVKSRILKIYNNDGQGLRQKQIESKHYERIKDRLILIIPNYSIVGLILRHDDKYKVIKSSRKAMFAHDVMTWQINDDKFMEARLSDFSRVFERGFIKWLDKYDDSRRKQFVDCIFVIFKKNNINSLIEIMEDSKKILTLLKETRNMDPVVKQMVRDLIVILHECNKEQLHYQVIK